MDMSKFLGIYSYYCFLIFLANFINIYFQNEALNQLKCTQCYSISHDVSFVLNSNRNFNQNSNITKQCCLCLWNTWNLGSQRFCLLDSPWRAMITHSFPTDQQRRQRSFDWLIHRAVASPKHRGTIEQTPKWNTANTNLAKDYDRKSEDGR